MPDRWTIYVCTDCGQATGRHKDCDGKREAVEVVPAAHAVSLDDDLLANLDERAARNNTDRAGYLRWVLTGKAPTAPEKSQLTP